MQFSLKVFGVAFMLSGGLWVLQGLDLVSWPTDSFMLRDSHWAVIGFIVFAVGFALFLRGNRKA
ncbi:MAG: hypothetical protein CL575_02860 [Altererythrobacter sp.]|nr:hypothetical protein [Altererythrobacter sp.]MBK61879.1 hypothetical protein [Altererythrobacter sp.]|tara:strand:- start:227 stop:418 length:192 start_codon:yes stop_codon:yes gene_type:complete